MKWDAALCCAYWDDGYRCGRFNVNHGELAAAEDAACSAGFCDCFREGYYTGMMDRRDGGES